MSAIRTDPMLFSLPPWISNLRPPPWRLKHPRQRTCEHPHGLYFPALLSLTIKSKPISRSCGSFISMKVLITDFGHHIGITMQDVLNRGCQLRLFVENEERELQTQDNRNWTPAQRPYAFTSPLHTLTKGCECVETSLRYLICAPRSI